MSFMRIVLACALAGCGGAPAVVERAQIAAPDDGCEAHATRLGETCWTAEGTRWRVLADGPSGAYTFELALLAAGRVRSSDHPSASPAHDEWFQDGPLLRILLADRFVEYRATVTNGTVIVGEARNVRGQRWPFRARRDFGEGRCATGEARLEGACMTVEGTRWSLEAPPRTIAFLEGGALGTSAADPPAGDRWTQEGTALTLTIDGREITAELVDQDTLRGTSAELTATRIESVPPIVWR